MWDFLIFLLPLQSGFDRKAPDTYWRDARVAEEARLESVCTPKGYREFESRSLRNPSGKCSPARKRRAVLVCGGRGACSPDDEYRNSTNDRQVMGCIPPKGCKDPPGGHRDSGGPPAAGISLKNHSLKSDEKPLSILPNHLLRRHTQRLVEFLPKRPDKRHLQELIYSNPLAAALLKGASTNIPAV